MLRLYARSVNGSPSEAALSVTALAGGGILRGSAVKKVLWIMVCACGCCVQSFVPVGLIRDYHEAPTGSLVPRLSEFTLQREFFWALSLSCTLSPWQQVDSP